MARNNSILLYAGIGVAAYFGYVYAVKNLMIPDYLGIVGGYPRTGDELAAAIAQLAAGGGQQQVGDGTGSGAGAGAGVGYGQGSQPGNSVAVGEPNPNTPTGNGQTTTPTTNSAKEALWEAAKAEAVPNNGRLHFWTWNYFLPAGIEKLDPFALGDAAWAGTPLGRSPVSEAEVQNTLLTLDQYWSMIAGASGMSGMRTGMRSVNAWGQQASQWVGSTGGYRIQ